MSLLPRAMTTMVLAVAGACAGAACGSGSDAGPPVGVDAAPPLDGSLADVAPGSDGGDAGGDSAAAPYPAFRPNVQQIASGGGAILKAPRIVPIVFANTAFTAQITDFLPKYLASAAWTAQVAEYGVGPATSVAPIMAVPLAGASVSLADLQTYVAQQVGGGAWGPPDTTEFGTSVYVIFLEPGVTITLPQNKSTCTGPSGFHNEVMAGTTHVPFAIVADCGKGMSAITRIASHEIAEAASDPYKLPNRAYYKVDVAWSTAFNGGENGDMCEHRTDANVTPADIGYAIQRTWSNAAAKAYHDPCVPAPTTPYFAAAPVLPDMVMLGAATVAGVKIPVGASKTIDVQLFSDGPTAPFAVKAQEYPSGTTLAFTWDATSGQNGTVLHLTIKATAAAPGGTTFLITSSLGGASPQWVGAVQN